MAFFNFLNWSCAALFPFLASFTTEISGPILYALHVGDSQRAFESYLAAMKEGGIHDFGLLQQAGKALLEQGIESKDPVIQLMCMFGAGVASSSDLLPILAKGIRSDDVRTQLTALTYLCKQQDDDADGILLEALSSPFLITRLEILLHLAKKNHPAVLGHLQALYFKVPEVVRPAFGQIAIHLEGIEGARYLRQLLSDADVHVRAETLLTIAEEERDDFLPSVRILASGASYIQQEAAAFALGELKDYSSLAKLKELAASKQEGVSLTAAIALYKLGERGFLEQIEGEAKRGSLYAIAALGGLKMGEETLFSLLNHPDRDVRINATLSLLIQKDKRALECLGEILFDEGRDLGFWQINSPGGALKAWKCISSASQKTKTYPGLISRTLALRERILTQCLEYEESDFLKIAHQLMDKKQHALIPLLVELLLNKKSEAILHFLKEGHQKAGAPLIRNYCTLALYHLKESGNYEEHLIAWIKAKGKEELIRFREEEEEEAFCDPHELTPEESSHFFVEVCEALASAQNQAGIEALIHTIAYGNPKNRYALAGLLMRTTE